MKTARHKAMIAAGAPSATRERISKLIGATDERLASGDEIGTIDRERWHTLFSVVLDQKGEEALRRDEDMKRATGLEIGMAQMICVLGELVALRRFSTAQLFELDSSAEAIQLCEEAMSHGLRVPDEAGAGVVLQFPRYVWQGTRFGASS